MRKDDLGRNENPLTMQGRFRLFTLWPRLARMFPRIQWTGLTSDEARELDLSTMVRWQALDFTWGTFGIVIAVRPQAQAPGGDGDA